MSRLSHNAVLKLRPPAKERGPNADPNTVATSDIQGPLDSEQGRKFDLWLREQHFAQETARRCLLSAHAPTKEWSQDLDIADRVVRRWASGAQLIPESRIPQIVALYHRYRMRSRDIDAEIDAAVDDMLVRAYGPGGRRSM